MRLARTLLLSASLAIAAAPAMAQRMGGMGHGGMGHGGMGHGGMGHGGMGHGGMGHGGMGMGGPHGGFQGGFRVGFHGGYRRGFYGGWCVGSCRRFLARTPPPHSEAYSPRVSLTRPA